MESPDCTTVVSNLDTSGSDVKNPYDMVTVCILCVSPLRYLDILSVCFIRHDSHTPTLHIGGLVFSAVPVTFLTNLDSWKCYSIRRIGCYQTCCTPNAMVPFHSDFYNSSWHLPHCHRGTNCYLKSLCRSTRGQQPTWKIGLYGPWTYLMYFISPIPIPIAQEITPNKKWYSYLFIGVVTYQLNSYNVQIETKYIITIHNPNWSALQQQIAPFCILHICKSTRYLLEHIWVTFALVVVNIIIGAIISN